MSSEDIAALKHLFSDGDHYWFCTHLIDYLDRLEKRVAELEARVPEEKKPEEHQAVEWVRITGRGWLAIVRLPCNTQPGDPVKLDGNDYVCIGRERPDLKGHCGLLIRGERK